MQKLRGLGRFRRISDFQVNKLPWKTEHGASWRFSMKEGNVLALGPMLLERHEIVPAMFGYDVWQR